MEVFRIRKPNLQHVRQAKVVEILTTGGALAQKIEKTSTPVYLSWDKIRNWPMPKDVKLEEFWAAVKLRRQLQRQSSPILSEDGQNFAWVKLAGLEEFFYEMDMTMGGSLFAIPAELGEKAKQRYLSRGVMEEAIASSQLEGAHTSRRVAKQMLREGRKPRTKDELMIVNNHSAMLALDGQYKHQPMTLEDLFDLHAILMKDIIKEDEVGRFRKDSEEIAVMDGAGGIIYHLPPKEAFVAKEMQRLLEFANDEDEGMFIHPIIKAIMLHFWIGYLHPFTDGNGRMARMLFYWYLLRKDYWAFAYLPLSSVIKKAPVQYGDAYIYSEQDDYDLTYFIDFNIRKIQQATREFTSFVEQKAKDNRKLKSLLAARNKFNDRQNSLLLYYIGNPGGRTNWSVHKETNVVSKQTAVDDLKGLERAGYIRGRKEGRNVFYYATPKLKKLSAKSTHHGG